MIKIIYSILAVIGTCSLCFATESRWRDGTIEFSVAEVNGETAWTASERQALIDKYDAFSGTSPVNVTNHSATKSEVAIATCALKYANYSEYKNGLNGTGLEEKITELRLELEKTQDLGDTQKEKQIKSRYQYLKNAYQDK